MKKKLLTYRPLLAYPFKKVAQTIAKELNKTSATDFDDLSVNRLALYELWKRTFPGQPFPPDAEALLKKYYTDPVTVQSV